MSINIAVKVLINRPIVEEILFLKFFKFKKKERFEIEDNIGEGIHIHYKNFRIDMSINDFKKFAETLKDFS